MATSGRTGRPRKPTSLLKQTGADKKHPERMRERKKEPKVLSPFPDKPGNHLCHRTQRAWYDIVTNAPEGVLTGADVFIVEALAALVAEFRKDPLKFPAQKHGHLRTYLNQLGYSPSGRASLMSNDGDDEDDDPFADIDKKPH